MAKGDVSIRQRPMTHLMEYISHLLLLLLLLRLDTHTHRTTTKERERKEKEKLARSLVNNVREIRLFLFIAMIHPRGETPRAQHRYCKLYPLSCFLSHLVLLLLVRGNFQSFSPCFFPLVPKLSREKENERESEPGKEKERKRRSMRYQQRHNKTKN